MGSRAQAEAELLFEFEADHEARAVIDAEEEAEALAEEAAHRPPARERVLKDPEEWADSWSEELVTLYHETVDRCAAYGWAILDKCTFSQFVEFCWTHSSRHPPAA